MKPLFCGKMGQNRKERSFNKIFNKIKNIKNMMKRNIVLVAVLVLVIFSGIGFFLYNNLPPKEIEDPLLKKIKEQGEIIVGTDATYPPMESIDEHGNFLGMDIDIAKEIAADLNVELKLVNIAWEEIFDAVREEEVDMIISSITITSERAETMGFSDPYFNAGQVIVIRTDKKEIIKGVEDLQWHNVGVQTETTSEEEVKKYVTDASLIKSYENYDLAKQDLLLGEIDAIIIDYPAAVGMVASEENLEIVGIPFTQEFYGIVTNKGQEMLLSQINRTIRRLKRAGEVREIEKRWLDK